MKNLHILGKYEKYALICILHQEDSSFSFPNIIKLMVKHYKLSADSLNSLTHPFLQLTLLINTHLWLNLHLHFCICVNVAKFGWTKVVLY